MPRDGELSENDARQGTVASGYELEKRASRDFTAISAKAVALGGLGNLRNLKCCPFPLERRQLEKAGRFCQNKIMSFAEMKEFLPTLTPEERASLLESLQALQEGVSIEEFRAINAVLDEEIHDPSPEISGDEVRERIASWSRRNAAKT